MEKNPIDMIYDENNSDPIVLYNEDDEAVSFGQVALIGLEDADYVILTPLSPMEGVAEDEGLVFVIQDDALEVVEDMDIVDQVFEEYYRLLKAEGIDV